MKPNLRRELSLILAGNILLLILVAINGSHLNVFLAVLRALLGLIYVLFIPGFMIQKLLFPQSIDLDNIERIAFSLALSGAIVPPIALLLNWLPWGIHLWPIVISISGLILVFMAGIVLRQSIVPMNDNLDAGKIFNIGEWWVKLGHQNRLVLLILAAVLITASLTSISILVMPKPAGYFTEFYMVGPDGRAEDFPREATVNQSLTVTLGITNHEQFSMLYHLEIWQVDPLDETHRQLVGSMLPFTIQVSKTDQWNQSWQPVWAGQDQKFEFLLFANDNLTPYRTLLLFINITQ